MKEDKVVQQEGLKIKPPRGAWRDLVLNFSTFGFYTSFWFYSTTRDINRISDKNLNPFMWFFAPLIVLAQFFAFPAFFRILRETELSVSVKGWQSWSDYLWIMLVISANIFAVLMDYIELGFSLFFVVLFIASLLLAKLQQRMNTLKENTELAHNKLYWGFSIPEWIALPLTLPFIIFCVWILSISPYLNELQSLDINDVVMDETGKYQLEIKGEGWIQSEIGRFSDGSAVFEVAGPGGFTHFILFKNGSDTISGLAQWRIGQAHDEMSEVSCKETRSLLKGTLNVASYILCQGKDVLGDKEYSTHYIVQTSDSLVELYGKYSTTEPLFEKHEDTFLSMSKGLIVDEK